MNFGTALLQPTPSGIAQAAQALADGELVTFPTETVYGLGADASNNQAVAAIFSAKGRPADHPLIVHLASAPSAELFAAQIPGFAAKLMAAHWPGPLTLICPKKPGVADAATGGHMSVGLRCPSHPVALALLQEAAKLGVHGVAAPSANPFGGLSPTTAQHVLDGFTDPGVLMSVLDGGPCSVGIESTIVDCTRDQPVLLRPGGISQATLEATLGQPVPFAQANDAAAPRASGTLAQHYAPRAKLRLMNAQALQAALDVLGSDAKHIAVYARSVLRSASAQVLLRRMPDDAEATAQQLFATLHQFDAAGVKLIWVEDVPPSPDWDAVRDRLQRAAA